MTGDCQLERKAKGHLECLDCHWIYKGKATNPRRNCPKSPELNSPEHRARVKETTLAELEPIALDSDLPAIAAQLDQCLELCERFNGRTCTARGSSCRLLTRWLEFLALMTGPCRRFEPSPG